MQSEIRTAISIRSQDGPYVPEWASLAQMGPKRDLIGDLANAVRRQGMVFGVFRLRVEHWWFMNSGRLFDSDVQNAERVDFCEPSQSEHLSPNNRFLEDWLARCCEKVDSYQPQIFWFDWWIEQPVFEPSLREFASYYYNLGVDWLRAAAQHWPTGERHDS